MMFANDAPEHQHQVIVIIRAGVAPAGLFPALAVSLALRR
jgi:hypothetical protein